MYVKVRTKKSVGYLIFHTPLYADMNDLQIQLLVKLDLQFRTAVQCKHLCDSYTNISQLQPKFLHSCINHYQLNALLLTFHHSFNNCHRITRWHFAQYKWRLVFISINNLHCSKVCLIHPRQMCCLKILPVLRMGIGKKSEIKEQEFNRK